MIDKKPRGPIKYNITLTEEQRKAKKLIEDNKVTVLMGKAGSSKSLVSCYTALNLLFTKQYKTIYLMRPAVPIEDIGFIPGEISNKLGPYVSPLMQNFYKIYDKQKIDALVKEERIVILPLAFVQGITVDEILIVDEAENAVNSQIKMILTRLGKGGKIIFTGDTDQVMLSNAKSSGFASLIALKEKEIPGFAVQELLENYRDPFVEQIITLYQ